MPPARAAHAAAAHASESTIARALVAFTLAALALAACVPPRAEHAHELVGPSTSLSGRRCALDATPEQLPDVAALLDTAALARDLATRGGASQERVEVLLSLAFDSLGRLASWHVVDSSPTADAIAATVAGHVRSQPAGRGGWGVRLLVSLSAPRPLRVGRRVICGAVPADERRRVAHRARTPSLSPAVYERPPAPISGGWMSGAPYHRPVRARVLVGASGEVLDVRLLNSSGMKATDRAIELSAYGRDFLPALADGAPTAAWTLVVY